MRAPANGTIRGTMDLGSIGSAVLIEHSVPGEGTVTTQFHHVVPRSGYGAGRSVAKGEQFATVFAWGGNTHLHFGVYAAPVDATAWNGHLPARACGSPSRPAFPTRFVNPTEYVKAHREPPTEGGGAAAIGRVLGDVDGDGRDDFILRRGTTFFINTDAVVPGGDRETDAEFQWGRADDQAFLGDVDGDGR